MSGVLPFTKEDLYFNKLPPTIIHLDTREVRIVNVRTYILLSLCIGLCS